MKEKNITSLILILLAIFFYHSILPPEWGLTQEGKNTLIILFLAIFLWVTELIPFPVTSLLILLLLPAFGLVSFQEAVYLGFGNPIIVFFIGIMTLSAALTRSGISERMTLVLLSSFGFATKRLILLFLLIGSFLSMWITNMGVAAILLPIGSEILKSSGRKILQSNFGKALMISIAWGCGLGGMGTPVGNGANVLTIGFMREMAGIDISFIQWMKFGIPAIFLLLPISWLILIKVFPPEIDELPLDKSIIENRLGILGPLTKKERNTILIFSLSIILWLFDPLLESFLGVTIPIQAVAVLAAVLIYLPFMEILSWKEAQNSIDWGAIVLIAGGLSLGQVLFETGAARWIAQLFLKGMGDLPLLLLLIIVVFLVQILKICFSSNTATGLVVIPIMIALAQELGIGVWTIIGPAALAISLAFILVPSSPTNVIPYGAGYFSIKDFAFSGLFISIIGILVIPVVFFLLLRM